MKVAWHPLARTDLAELVAYIATDSPAAAYRVHNAIREQVKLLAIYPEIGRPGRVRGTREFVVQGTPYIAAYRNAAGIVTVLRLLHGARLWPRKL
jgi:toxin ParE1/3/4